MALVEQANRGLSKDAMHTSPDNHSFTLDEAATNVMRGLLQILGLRKDNSVDALPGLCAPSSKRTLETSFFALKLVNPKNANMPKNMNRLSTKNGSFDCVWLPNPANEHFFTTAPATADDIKALGQRMRFSMTEIATQKPSPDAAMVAAPSVQVIALDNQPMGVMLAPSEAAAHNHEIAHIAAMLQGHKQTNFGLTARSLKPFTGPRTPRWVSREIALGPRERLHLLHLNVPPHEFPDRIRVFGYFRGGSSNSTLLSETHTAAMQGYRQGTAFTAAWSQRDFAIYAWTPIAIAILEHLSAGLTDGEIALWTDGALLPPNRAGWLAIARPSAIPAGLADELHQREQEAHAAAKAMEDLAAQTGLQRAIDSSNATYARLHGTNDPHSLPCSYKALTPCPITPGMVTHHPVAFHIKPGDPSRAKEGVFSVEALREWTCGYGPVLHAPNEPPVAPVALPVHEAARHYHPFTFEALITRAIRVHVDAACRSQIATGKPALPTYPAGHPQHAPSVVHHLNAAASDAMLHYDPLGYPEQSYRYREPTAILYNLMDNFRSTGRFVFDFSPIVDLLELTDTDARMTDVLAQLPYPVFYLHFGRNFVPLEEGGAVSGVYVHQGSNGLVALTYATSYQTPGDLPKTAQERAQFLVDVTRTKTLLINPQSADMAKNLSIAWSLETTTAEDDRISRLVLGALAYLATPRADIEDSWTGDPPAAAIERTRVSDPAARARAKELLRERGFRYVRLVGRRIAARYAAIRKDAERRQIAIHWRRGHWHQVACGVGKTRREWRLYPPILVQGAKGPSPLGTVYRIDRPLGPPPPMPIGPPPDRPLVPRPKPRTDQPS